MGYGFDFAAYFPSGDLAAYFPSGISMFSMWASVESLLKKSFVMVCLGEPSAVIVPGFGLFGDIGDFNSSSLRCCILV